MNEQEIKEINNRLKAKELEEERIAKKLHYKNVDSIRKNVQFFFWATVASMTIYFFVILIDNASKI
jgi:hypothetical protein